MYRILIIKSVFEYLNETISQLLIFIIYYCLYVVVLYVEQEVPLGSKYQGKISAKRIGGKGVACLYFY